MREFRLSGSVEGVVCKHDSYSDSFFNFLVSFSSLLIPLKRDELWI